MTFLYDAIVREFGNRQISQTAVPSVILDNLRPGYGRRPYQIEAFQRFLLCHSENFEGKPGMPLHLLYNMATGSGKTLIMAGLMLYLYERGYRNFLFFVDSSNIIRKTKDNFLNPQAGKYLFNNKLMFDGNEALIKEVENFEQSDAENINIKFTTIQQLHFDLNNTKENSITFEDFADKKIVLIADEAHHFNTATRGNGNLLGSWEDTVMKIHDSNLENILLEFTATVEYENAEIAGKYRNKVIYRYDLAQFRNDKYSKEINLIHSHYDEEERIIQALILNLYRQELATANGINLKPVILFKARRTVAESERNKTQFHQLIEGFSAGMVNNIRQTSKVAVVQKAFGFFDAANLSSVQIAERIQSNFREENCLSANNEAEAEKNQILLNTLEDENNPIRAVFAVQKLNEGWDVLNLFDIVRLYDGRDARAGKPGPATISEAQLIGRGARYFPFSLEEGQDPHTRKFDDDMSNDLKILEELYYHTKEDSRYISEIKRALVDTGIYEDESTLELRQLTLKPAFRETEFYKTGRVFFNEKIEKRYDNVKSFADLNVARSNYAFTLSSGSGEMIGVFTDEDDNQGAEEIRQKDIAVKDIPPHVVRAALSRNPFFDFDNLTRYFPNIDATSQFIKSRHYLSGLEITVSGAKNRLANITHHDYLLAVGGLLASIEMEIKASLTEYEGSDYMDDLVHNVFKDKQIRVPADSERADGQCDVVSEAEWYAYNANYGTSEEKAFVKMFARRFEHLQQKFKNIYLLRNEREIKIYDHAGRAFEPDFILFCQQKDGENLIYQVFIEPKGAHLIANDKWKEDFLNKIRADKRTIRINADKYRITGVPFYNNANENQFKATLEATLNDNDQRE